MQCVRTLLQHSSTVKIKELKRHVPNMQTSNQFLLNNKQFTVELISSKQGYHRTKLTDQKTYMTICSNLQKTESVIHCYCRGSVAIAAFLRQSSRLCCSAFEGRGTELLYVHFCCCFLFPVLQTCKQKRIKELVNKKIFFLKRNLPSLPGNGANLLIEFSCTQNIICQF